MSVTLALVVGGLTSVGVYLITSRSLTRMLLGFALLGHAAVVALLAAGGEAGGEGLSCADEPLGSGLAFFGHGHGDGDT